MQSQEPPAPDGEQPPAGGHARHRRRRTDPPIPPDGAPLFRKEPPPRTVAEYLSRRDPNPARGTETPPPWALERADPHGRRDRSAARPGPAVPEQEAPGPTRPEYAPARFIAVSEHEPAATYGDPDALGEAAGYSAPDSPATGVPGVPPSAGRASAHGPAAGPEQDESRNPRPVPRPRPTPRPRPRPDDAPQDHDHGGPATPPPGRQAVARVEEPTAQETTGPLHALAVPVGGAPDRDDTAGDEDSGAGRPEPPPGRRRTLPTDTDRTRRVSDAARERGLPVRDREQPAAVADTGHGHGHGHSPATPAGKRVRILLAALLVPCALAALAGVALLWPGTSPVPSVPPQQQVHGDVGAVQAADCTPGSGSGGCTGVTVRLTDGPRAGSDLVQLVPAEPSTPRFAVGDRIVLAYSGGNPDDAGSYQITDFQRGAPLIWLAAAFAVAVLLLGRWRGLAALVALGLTFAVLVLFVLPSILSGNNPLAVAVTGAGVIMFMVLYLSHGFSARTSCAVLGTLVSLALIGGLGALFTVTTRLTGLDDTTANLIGTVGNVPIDARGLLLAGLVIGALGVLDDVTVTQASAVWELRDANASMGPGALFAAGMRIGRDHVSSAVNTLVLAYAGAALPLMLLFTVSSAGFGQVLTSQDVATEIVRTLVGSIGLVASVPLTTGLAALVAARR